MPRLAQALAFVVCALLALGQLVSSLPADHVLAAPSLHYLYGSGSATGGRDISLRIELTSRAPPGGVRVRLASSNLAIQVPGSVAVPAGERDVTISASTSAVATDLDVRVQAELNGQTRSRIVRVLAPRLSSLSVQSKMRAGGVGKVTISLTGIAPKAGVEVLVSSNRPSLITPQSPVIIDAGRRTISLTVPVGIVMRDTPVNIIVRLDGNKLVSSTLIRNYDLLLPTATPTLTTSPTATLTPSATITPTGTGTVALTPPPPTATWTTSPVTGTLTATPSPSPSATATSTASPQIAIELLNESDVLAKGSIARFRLCLISMSGSGRLVSFRSSNETVALQSDISPIYWITPIQPNQEQPCADVSMPGRREPEDNLGVGVVNLIANLDGLETSSPPVTFFLMPTSTPDIETSTPTPVPTDTPTSSASSTRTPTWTGTPVPPTATPTPMSSPSPANSPTATPAPSVTPTADPIVITLVGAEDTFPVGAKVTFKVCLSSALLQQQFPTLSSNNDRYFATSSISPGNVVMQPGACVEQSVTSASATGPSAPAFLVANLGGMNYQSPPVWFVEE